MARSDELVEALMTAQAGGVAGITGAPSGRTWDAFASAHAPEIAGDTVGFVTLADGTVIVNEDQPDGALGPLADAIEEMARPPYRAAAVRSEGDAWTVVAEKVSIVELPGVDGDDVELTVVGGVRELRIDDISSSDAVPALDALTEEHGDVALHAERIDSDTFAVDVFPL